MNEPRPSTISSDPSAMRVFRCQQPSIQHSQIQYLLIAKMWTNTHTPKNIKKTESVIWWCARVVWIIIIEMATVNFLSTRNCISHWNACIYYLFFFVRLQITHVCIVCPCPFVRRSPIRSFDTHICCKLFFLLLINLCFFCWCYWVLLLLLLLQLLFSVGMWSILVRWSMIDWISMSWFKEPFSREKKRCELYARVSIILLVFFWIPVGRFKCRHLLEDLPFVCWPLSANDNYAFDEIYNFEMLTFR